MENGLGNLRRQVVENSEELQDFIRDLSNWENDIKKRDAELRQQPPVTKNLPPIRKSAVTEVKKTATTKDHRSMSDPEEGEKNQLNSLHEDSKAPQRISSYDYAAWDKFNVEEALKEVEEKKENSNSSSSSDDNEEEEEIKEQQLKQKALLEKDRGNRFFCDGKYDDAIACYTSGIQADPTNAVLPANRAMALIKKGQLAAAEQDCTLSISLDCTYTKAFHRRATCRLALKKLQLARQDFLKVLEMEPSNKFARIELDKLQLEFQRLDKPQQGVTSPPGDLGSVSDKPSSNISGKLVNISQGSSSTSNELLVERKGNKMDLMTGKESKLKKKHKTFDVGNKNVFADLPDQVQPVYKDSHLRSKKPLKRIPVEVRSSDEEPEDLVIPPPAERPSWLPTSKPSSARSPPSMTPVSTPVSTPQSLPPVPHSAFQFETDWRRLRHWPHLRSQYLRNIAPESLRHMYQKSIETEIFIDILHCLKDISTLDKETTLLYLKNLSQVGRFGTIVMFLDPEEMQVIRDILSVISPVASGEEIESLKLLFGV